MNIEEIKLKTEKIKVQSQEISTLILQVKDKLSILEGECYPPHQGIGSDSGQELFSEAKHQLLKWSDQMICVLDFIIKSAEATRESLKDETFFVNNDCFK